MVVEHLRYAKLAVTPFPLFKFSSKKKREGGTRRVSTRRGAVERATDAKNLTEGIRMEDEEPRRRMTEKGSEWPRKLRVSNHRRILWDHNSACRSVEVLKDSLCFISSPSCRHSLLPTLTRLDSEQR